MVSSIPIVFNWGGSIGPEGFWPFILLLTIIIVTIAIVVAIVLVVVDTIIRIVVVVVGVPSIIKLAFMITACVSRAVVTLSATNCLMALSHGWTMSSPNHPTSNIEDAFSSPNYTSSSPDYSPASTGNTPSESLNNSYGLVPIVSPTLSLFHDDPYMKAMHAYDTIMPPPVPIPPLIIVPLSPILTPIFNP
uniref:Uncharacterized protein n=1 Tax=Tanacetum cinerariifolium TaxID=118510 RepID=A0A699JEJ2_TANCI|nr:hypothetical protein [Tanacetum cinerariifolium]